MRAILVTLFLGFASSALAQSPSPFVEIDRGTAETAPLTDAAPSTEDEMDDAPAVAATREDLDSAPEPDEDGVVEFGPVDVEGEIDTPDAVYVLSPTEVDPGALPSYSPLDDPEGH